MTLGQCDEVELLIDREARGWTDAERLLVEQHLHGCADCLENLTFARVVRETITAAPYALSEGARSRVIDRALSSEHGSFRPVIAGRRSLYALSAAGLVAAAAAAFLLVGRPATEQPVAVAPAPAVQPAAIPPSAAPQLIEVEAREVHQLAHARVELAPGTRIRFDAARTTVQLERGQVDVDVDVSEGRPFRVSTSQFRVEVLGTQFSVTPDSVHVRRGHVQVFATDGSTLARDLSAGASFSYGSEQPARTGQVDDGSASRTVISAHALLARAREALSRNNTRVARELLERAERSDPRRSDLAEASTLRAEVSLLERDSASALRSYLLVASRYPELTAGENAAFAAAKLAARTEPGRERELLTRYLKRYPQGRFADECRQRLAKLPR